MPRKWRGVIDCTSCGKAKAEVGVGAARLCGHCWCMMMWGKAWADKSHPNHPHAEAATSQPAKL